MKTATKTQLQINKYYSKIVSMCISNKEVERVISNWGRELKIVTFENKNNER